VKFVEFIDPKVDCRKYGMCEVAVNAALSFLMFPLLLFVFAVGLWFPAFPPEETRP